MTTRFIPDTLRDSVLRPVAMAAPDAGVYVEFSAPDFRFVFLVLLTVVPLLIGLWRRQAPPAVLVLVAFTAAAFVPWLATSGNGRYFIAYLLLAGPLCIGLLQLLPVTRSLRLAIAASMILWQGYLLYDIAPWGSWTFVRWVDGPAFHVDVPPEVAAKPATYVGMSNISYSLIAPQFHPDSRWINISGQRGLGDTSPDGLRTQAFLEKGDALKLIFPSQPGGTGGHQLDNALAVAVNDLLARQGLSIADQSQCRLLRSRSLYASVSSGRKSAAEEPMMHGFWLCDLARRATARSITAQPIPPRSQAVFIKLERTCPRLFPRGDGAAVRIPAGAVRGYPSSDFKIYVLDDGTVMYKYLRALNPEILGTVEAVLGESFRMNCEQVRGRTGLPWERGI